ASAPKRQRVTLTLEKDDMERLEWCLEAGYGAPWDRSLLVRALILPSLQAYSELLKRCKDAGLGGLDAQEILRSMFEALSTATRKESKRSSPEADRLILLAEELEHIQFAIEGAGPVIRRCAEEARKQSAVASLRNALGGRNGRAGGADHLKPVPPI